MKTHVYLDVDGVLNACNRHEDDPGWGWGNSELVTVLGYPIRYSPAMVAALNALAEHMTFHWLTTWRHDAPAHLAPAIGLRGESWPVLDRDDPLSVAGWWKFDAIRDHVERTRPDRAFWIDDDIRYFPTADDWLNLESTVVVPICPLTRVGLTREHVELLEVIAR